MTLKPANYQRLKTGDEARAIMRAVFPHAPAVEPAPTTKRAKAAAKKAADDALAIEMARRVRLLASAPLALTRALEQLGVVHSKLVQPNRAAARAAGHRGPTPNARTPRRVEGVMPS